MTTAVTSSDLMMMRQAAINWLKKNSEQNPHIRIAGHIEAGVIHLTLHGVKLPAEDGFTLLGALEAIRPEGVKIEVLFPDNR